MENIRIKAAILHFNNNVRKENEPRMTQRSLGLFVIPSNGDFYISNWSNGKHLGKLKPEHVRKICEFTKVDANFLFGTKKMEL